ncbi:MAG: hypothetical protein ACI3XI_01760 [Eubacteriales bacterium]
MTRDHIIYLFGSLCIVALILLIAYRIKSEKYKNLFLFIVAFCCFGCHISTIYTSFFNNGGFGTAVDNQLFPIYFCNYMMDLLVIISLWPNKRSRFFKILATFVAYGGAFGGLITVFASDPGFGNWSQLQSAFSHSFLLLGSLYLFVGGYVKINVYNLIPYAYGLLSCGVFGGLVELIFYLGGLESPNAMYLVHGPVELPVFKWWMFVISMLAIIFVFTALWEHFTRKKEDRWFRTAEDLFEYIPHIHNKSQKY